MSKLKELIRSPRRQIELATGISIIAIACFSKWVLPRPIGYLPTALPPFIATVYEALLNRNKDHRVFTTWYWIAAIFLTTALVIVLTALMGPDTVP
jgi:predicted histidine transporter YuiF (NhaC family)